jgi:hypothetical protein
MIINIDKLHESIQLSDYQKIFLSRAIEAIMDKYKSNQAEYFDGIVDGLNHAYKIVNGIDDDYNS